MKTVKETKELLSALELLGVKLKLIAKNGVGVDDLAQLLDLVKAHEVLLEGFKDLKEVDDELKDLSQEEVVELVMALLKLAKSLKDA